MKILNETEFIIICIVLYMVYRQVILKFIFRHKLGSLPGNEVLNQGAISYLIVISMQVLVKSIIVIFRVHKFHKELKG